MTSSPPAVFILSPEEFRRAPLTSRHSEVQRAGHLIRTRQLDASRVEAVRAGLTREGRGLGGHTDTQTAHDFEIAAKARGIDCYTRCWHQGDVGWFTIRTADYSRVLPRDLEDR